MKKYNARGTWFLRTDWLNACTPYEIAQYLEVENAGWAISNHTRDHLDLTTLSDADVIAQWTLALADLTKFGFGRGKYHGSYPGSQFNAAVKIDTAAGILSARAGWSGTGGLALNPWTLQYEWVHAASVAIPTWDLAGLKGLVDGAIAGNKTLAILIHAIPTNITIANFQALVDYIVAHNLPFITINDVWDSLSGPITVPII
jgi:peptidoglycan/xylan/chitin deacetylase (PgdA/CDA1 family)